MVNNPAVMVNDTTVLLVCAGCLLLAVVVGLIGVRMNKDQ